jgi:glycerophosphoryl diester phosphodiesterase
MLISAHRGLSGLFPENTMLAFQKAAEAGCDEIELDVQLSRDGTVVIFHDETLDRVTGKSGWVKDVAFNELQILNVTPPHEDAKHEHSKNNAFGVNRIPSLDEYFSWVAGTNITTNIELKNSIYYYPGLEEKTVELIHKHKLSERVIFSTFNHLSLIKCKSLAPEIKCGALVPEIALVNPGFLAKSFGVDFFHPCYTALTDEAAADCLAWGIGINTWTVNDTSLLPRLETWNCRSVITNYPNEFREYQDGRTSG